VLARLAGIEIRIPTLRTRIEDLPALVGFLWMRAQARPVAIAVNALEALAIHAWPGNVRELDHALRAAALVDRNRLELEALPDAIRERLRDARRISVPALKPAPGDARAEVEAALVEHRGNLRRVATTLGIARGHLYRLLKRWELDPAAFRGGAR
jgi:two-component system NtrC family response regulator